MVPDRATRLKCDRAFDLWQDSVQLASELESELRETVDWGNEWLANFNACLGW